MPVKKIFKLSNLIPLTLVVYITKSFIKEPMFFDYIVVFLMSISFLYKLKLDKDEITDKDKLIESISHLEEESKRKLEEFEQRYEEKIVEIRNIQNNDRLAAETKFSTLNLGMQRQQKNPQEKNSYGWSAQR